jgi:thiamine biosynthesis protein ThiS
MIQINQFLLNGQKYYTNRPINLLNLVNYFNYNNSILVIEYNNLICNKKNLRKIYINDKDKIEILTIVGGG